MQMSKLVVALSFLVILFAGFAAAWADETSMPNSEEGVSGSRADVAPESAKETAAEFAPDLPAWWPEPVKDYWSVRLFKLDGREILLGDVVWAVAVFLLILIGLRVAQAILRRTLLRHLRADKEESKRIVDDLILTVVDRTKGLIVFLLAVYFALITLPLSSGSRKILDGAAIILVTVQVAIWASTAVVGLIEKEKRRRMEGDPSAAAAFGLLGFFARVGVWSAAVLLVLTNLGYQIGPLLAGLGVGGVAVAFALQSILGDIFCSIAIVLDKPFVLGDFIIVGDFMGSVENIGIKTTRLRSISGEQIVFSNADLLGSRVRNYKRMYERRVVFPFGIVYETPLEQVKRIPDMVRGIIEPLDEVRFDRAHFKEFGDFSLNFEVVYYVLTPDYTVYMDIQQRINLELFEAFEKEDIAFAYPTQEVVLRRGSASEPSA